MDQCHRYTHSQIHTNSTRRISITVTPFS